jgi:hypothetical protein
MDANVPLWRVLFDRALEDAGPVEVARSLGYSNHTLVSLIRSGKKDASDKFQTRVLAAYNVVQCPHSGQEQPRALCATWLGKAAPTHNPASLSAWRDCQRCPHRPATGSKK